jgi:hypothetical protein
VIRQRGDNFGLIETETFTFELGLWLLAGQPHLREPPVSIGDTAYGTDLKRATHAGSRSLIVNPCIEEARIYFERFDFFNAWPQRLAGAPPPQFS